MANLEAWRALVDKELAGAPFDKLVFKTPEGLAIEPLYAERAIVDRFIAEPWKLCMRVEPGDDVQAELAAGADLVWSAKPIAGVPCVTDEGFISALAWHDAGADAADEIALTLASLVAALRAEDKPTSVRMAVGRDTFGELCKLRALRVCWHKVLAAVGADRPLVLHAVCASRTLAVRDPWVNMLRVTTQVFAAALGGAQLVTPLAFDAGFEAPSPLGRRIARNTALVLREESQLGRVLDAAGGSYYIEARTDALAREAWARFQQIERVGGLAQVDVAARLEAAWQMRAAAIAKRKEPVLGVSEFANLREHLPGTPRPFAGHRDSEGFEALRARVAQAPKRVGLVLLGPPAEHRARAGYAESLFAVAGLALSADNLDVACICGSDERYASEAAQTARDLKAAGVSRVVLAGRPGALEAELAAAGVDAFVFIGADILAVLSELL